MENGLPELTQILSSARARICAYEVANGNPRGANRLLLIHWAQPAKLLRLMIEKTVSRHMSITGNVRNRSDLH